MRFRVIAALGAVLSLCSFGATAGDFPSKELTIIAPGGPGGSLDRTARSVQRFLPDVIGKQVLVENNIAAAGKIAVAAFMDGKADGHAILATFLPGFTKNRLDDPDQPSLDDLAIVNLQWSDPGILVARKDTGWTSIDDMIKDVRANPGKFTFGSSSPISAGHILAVKLFDALDLDIKIVPYKGGGKTRAAFLGGHVQMTAAGAGGALRVKDEAVSLGLFSDKALDSWPEATPINEALAGHGITVPTGGAYRFFAVQKSVRDEHPEVFAAIVEAFRAVVEENEGFGAFAKETRVGADWLGPEASTEILKKIDADLAVALAR